jgi:hypothetical protein
MDSMPPALTRQAAWMALLVKQRDNPHLNAREKEFLNQLWIRILESRGALTLTQRQWEWATLIAESLLFIELNPDLNRTADNPIPAHLTTTKTLAERLGITPAVLGRWANQHGMKSETNGELWADKLEMSGSDTIVGPYRERWVWSPAGVAAILETYPQPDRGTTTA